MEAAIVRPQPTQSRPHGRRSPSALSLGSSTPAGKLVTHLSKKPAKMRHNAAIIPRNSQSSKHLDLRATIRKSLARCVTNSLRRPPFHPVANLLAHLPNNPVKMRQSTPPTLRTPRKTSRLHMPATIRSSLAGCVKTCPGGEIGTSPARAGIVLAWRTCRSFTNLGPSAGYLTCSAVTALYENISADSKALSQFKARNALDMPLY